MKYVNNVHSPIYNEVLHLYIGECKTSMYLDIWIKWLNMKLINENKIAIVATFIRLYGDALGKLADHYDKPIVFRRLNITDNQYGDIMARIGNTIYVSEEEVGKMGLSDPEVLAALAHEVGHVIYATRGWDADCEQRADSVASDLGLGKQMISAIEKFIESRRYPRLTSLLVSRIHFLQNIEYAV